MNWMGDIRHRKGNEIWSNLFRESLTEKRILSEDMRKLSMEIYAHNPSLWGGGIKAQGS